MTAPAHHVGLVACSAQKSVTREEYERRLQTWCEVERVNVTTRTPPPIPRAEDLYCSQLYTKARAWAQRHCDAWFILSARHRLLSPDALVVPYDQTLKKMPPADRSAWARHVVSSLQRMASQGPYVGCGTIAPGARITILAGAAYRQGVAGPLRELGFTVAEPLAGLGIGQQLQWLKRGVGRQGELFAP